MRVDQLWIHPVKSFIGLTVPSVAVTELGIVGDRRWAIRDHERGGIRGAKKIGELMRFAAVPLEDDPLHVAIDFPDGSRGTTRDHDIHARLSTTLGRTVTIEALPDDGALEHFRRGPGDSADPLTELRGIFGREPDEPLPNFSAFPPEVAEFESPPGTHHDCWPLMVMSTSAMAALASALPDSVVDIRRFRPSLVVDTGDVEGHPEFSWSGRTARVGSAVVEFLSPCPRCVMVTRAIDDTVGEDRAVLRHIVRDLDQNVGVYARIVQPGAIVTGDAVEFG